MFGIPVFYKYNLFFCFIILIAIFTGCSVKKLPITSSDHRILFEVSDLKNLLRKEAINLDKEVMSKKLNSKGLYKLAYEYKYKGLYLQSTVIVAPDIRMAKQHYNELLEGLKVRFTIIEGMKKGMEFKEVSGFPKHGQKTQFFIIKGEKKTTGNALTVMTGNKVFSLLLIGIYFDKTPIFSRTVSPKLRFLRSYKP